MKKGYYHGVYVLLQFNKENGIYIKGYYIDMWYNLEKDETEDAILDDGKQCHYMIFFGDNNGGIDDKKELIHARRWD